MKSVYKDVYDDIRQFLDDLREKDTSVGYPYTESENVDP